MSVSNYSIGTGRPQNILASDSCPVSVGTEGNVPYGETASDKNLIEFVRAHFEETDGPIFGPCDEFVVLRKPY